MIQVIAKSDAAIQEDVLRELRWDTRVEATDVGVEVDASLVSLTGTVSNYVKKLAAQEAAHRVRGVQDVVNNITVTIPGISARTDADIAQAVRHALKWDLLIPEEHIQTTVANGWVTLDGQVERWSQRQDAEHSVQHLEGVHGVMNRIAVKVPTPDPNTVRTAIDATLERQMEREADRIQVTVHEGTVTLSGNVRTWAEKQTVLGAAGHAPGVQHLDDKLHINSLL